MTPIGLKSLKFVGTFGLIPYMGRRYTPPGGVGGSNPEKLDLCKLLTEKLDLCSQFDEKISAPQAIFFGFALKIHENLKKIVLKHVHISKKSPAALYHCINTIV